jgi:transketolase
MNPTCKEIRKKILEISCATGHGHLPTCFSVVEILLAVYQSMRHDPKNPSWPQRDIFVLSKGHAALGHYCVLADLGYFPAEKLDSFGAFMSDLGCHADRCKVPGIEVSTGSLGHGIGVSVGVALASRIRKIDRQVITLIGDGEANEGSVWEAIMVAVDLKLNNLTVIFDHNMSQVRGLQIYNPAEKFAAFGCDVVEVNGHEIGQIKSALAKPSDRVKVIVARTKKGFGCRTFVQNQFEWHRKSPTQEELLKLKGELDEEAI